MLCSLLSLFLAGAVGAAPFVFLDFPLVLGGILKIEMYETKQTEVWCHGCQNEKCHRTNDMSLRDRHLRFCCMEGRSSSLGHMTSVVEFWHLPLSAE